MTLDMLETRVIIGGDCTYPARDGLAIEAYLARPEAPGRHAAVIVLHARNGLQPFFKETADELARRGFVGFAIGWQTRLPPNDERRLPSDRDVVDDIGSGIEYLRAQAFVDSGRLGIMGFCAGGTFVYLAASVLEGLRSAVAHYGAPKRFREAMPQAEEGRMPTAYELAEGLTPSLLIVQGDQDPAIPMEDVYDYRDRLHALGKEVDLAVYAGMGHAFTIRGTRSYDEEAARAAWDRTVAHFARTLAA